MLKFTAGRLKQASRKEFLLVVLVENILEVRDNVRLTWAPFGNDDVRVILSSPACPPSLTRTPYK